MKHFTLCTGRKMPALGLGTSRIEHEKIEPAIMTALDAGYRHIDTAAIYKNELPIGAALQKGLKQYPRPDLWITSKLWCDAHKPDDVMTALKDSLYKLQLDYLDLYLMHFPVALRPGTGWPTQHEDYYTLEEVPLSETWEAMEHCVKKGLVRDIGTSNFSTVKLHDLAETARIQPAVNQIEMHPYQQQHLQRDYAKRHHILLTAYSPLGSSVDTMQQADGTKLPPLLTHPVINEIAEEHDATAAQVLLAWLMAIEVAVIPRSSSPERIQENFKATSLALTPLNIATIAELHAKAKIFNAAGFTEYDSPYSLESIWDGELYT
ncbi:aldehyde oxidoreductase [Halodesulfovibrio spirochaetisodalis]|uniref:Aldehyde oxidoreductase n=2 Tax=Halodesulfovibrio spirochaetisodalis TaxID=1560234 RepID=A0A1B7XC63_9BACT|nr:aldehyde oxidoreductase [Halodesulfovibrio spirochaetisodalis]